MEALKAAWSRVRASAGVFAHSAISEAEAELAKVAGDLLARLEACEKACGIAPPASSTTDKPAA